MQCSLKMGGGGGGEGTGELFKIDLYYCLFSIVKKKKKKASYTNKFLITRLQDSYL